MHFSFTREGNDSISLFPFLYSCLCAEYKLGGNVYYEEEIRKTLVLPVSIRGIGAGASAGPRPGG